MTFQVSNHRRIGTDSNQGIGNGFVVATGPVYVAETTGKVKERGPLVGILMGFACVGTALAYWVDFGFTYASGQVAWRLPVAIQIFWSLLTVVLCFPNADSPRWYFLRGRVEEGQQVLQQIYPDDPNMATKVAAEIQAELSQESGDKLKFSDFFVDRSETKAATRIRDGLILVGVAYLMGINMIFYYMTTIFQVYIGLEPTTSSICSGAATTLLAIGTFVGSIFCEKGGRRKWLLWGSALQSVFMIAFVALLAVGTKAASSAAAAMLFAWIFVFSPTWAPLPVSHFIKPPSHHLCIRHTNMRSISIFLKQCPYVTAILAWALACLPSGSWPSSPYMPAPLVSRMSVGRFGFGLPSSTSSAFHMYTSSSERVEGVAWKK